MKVKQKKGALIIIVAQTHFTNYETIKSLQWTSLSVIFRIYFEDTIFNTC